MTLPNIYDKKPLTISVGKLIPRKRKLDSDVMRFRCFKFQNKIEIKIKIEISYVHKSNSTHKDNSRKHFKIQLWC